jgi:hypothetical protein
MRHHQYLIMDEASKYFEQAAHMNANGVVSLQEGDGLKAFQHFMNALSTLSKFRQYLMSLNHHDPHQASSLPAKPPCGSRTGARNGKAIAVPFLEDNGFYIYSNALIFPRTPSVGNQQDEEAEGDSRSTTRRSSGSPLDRAAFCEGCCLFNLSLVFHQRGKHCGEDKTRALDLYE